MAILLAACLISAGCVTENAGNESAATLPGTAWSLQSYIDADGSMTTVLQGTEITLIFSQEENTTGGYTGCNHYGGSYRVNGEAIEITSIHQTLRLCTEPEGVMVQEGAYLAALASAATYAVDAEGRLILSDSTGRPLLTYEPLPAEAPPAQVGTSWHLLTYADDNRTRVSILPGTTITLIFDDEKNFTGSAGCNHYGGSYRVDGETFSTDSIFRTEMYCLEPEGVMEQEDAYLAALEAAAAYKVDAEGRLILFDASGMPVLFYEQVIPPEDLPLVDTRWVLEAFSPGGDTVSSVIAGSQVTLAFSGDGRIAGSGGCNHYGGSYRVNGEAIEITSINRTLKYCLEPEGVTEQENTYFELLESSAEYRIEKERLLLFDASGAMVLTFRAGS